MAQELEETLAFIKPEGFEDDCWIEILAMITASGLIITGMAVMQPNEQLMARHYLEHPGKEHYQWIMDQTVDRTLLVMIITGENAVERARNLSGPWQEDQRKDRPDAIRSQFMEDGTPGWRNFTHTSADPAAAKRECGIWRPFLVPLITPHPYGQ